MHGSGAGSHVRSMTTFLNLEIEKKFDELNREVQGEVNAGNIQTIMRSVTGFIAVLCQGVNELAKRDDVTDINLAKVSSEMATTLTELQSHENRLRGVEQLSSKPQQRSSRAIMDSKVIFSLKQLTGKESFRLWNERLVSALEQVSEGSSFMLKK